MTDMWYRGYVARGVPKEVTYRIASEIKKFNYGNFMPRICVEPSRKRSEFYFFIGINSDNPGEPPIETVNLEKWLSLQHIRVFSGGECVFHDELTKSWLKREIDITYTRQLTRWKLNISDSTDENPFDLSIESKPNKVQNNTYNQLLYWLSMNGDGSWQTFQNACEQLNIEKSNEPRHLFRRLRLLGHGEYLENASRWTVCPPCLVQAESFDGRFNYFLAGGRSPKIIDALPNKCEISQAEFGAPDVISVSFDSYEEVQCMVSEINNSTCCNMKLVGNFSAELATLLPDIKGWQKSFLTRISINTERFKIHRWNGDDFSVWVNSPNEYGMYRLIDTHLGDQAPIYYYFFDPQENSWYQGDWYGLRFLANWYLENFPVLTYNTVEKKLFVPNANRLPDIYEKTLVLASGELATNNNGGAIYKKISPKLVEHIARKLGAKIERR
jgi:hypothetical protein